MKRYKGFNVITNQAVGYFTKEEAEAMTKNPAYKSISFINETPKSDENENAKARKQNEEKEADAEHAKETVVAEQPKKKAEKTKE